MEPATSDILAPVPVEPSSIGSAVLSTGECLTTPRVDIDRAQQQSEES